MSKDKDNFDPDADLNDLINDEKSAKNPNQQKSLSDNVDVERLIDEQQSREQIESPSEPVYSDRAEDVVHEPTRRPLSSYFEYILSAALLVIGGGVAMFFVLQGFTDDAREDKERLEQEVNTRINEDVPDFETPTLPEPAAPEPIVVLSLIHI